MCTVTAGITLFTTFVSANQQRRQGQHQEAVAEYNARVDENTAQDTINAGTEAENAHREQVQQLLARQQVQLAAGNIDTGSGSALKLQDDTIALGEADALRIRSNAASRASALTTQASLTTQQGAHAASAGNRAAAGSLLSGTAATLNTGVADHWFTPDSTASQTWAASTAGTTHPI